jgi:hypothetical protein
MAKRLAVATLTADAGGLMGQHKVLVVKVEMTRFAERIGHEGSRGLGNSFLFRCRQRLRGLAGGGCRGPAFLLQRTACGDNQQHDSGQNGECHP